MHTTIKKTPTHYSEMLDHLSISLSDFARSLASGDSALPWRCMAVNLDTKQAAIVVPPDSDRLAVVCHQAQ